MKKKKSLQKHLRKKRKQKEKDVKRKEQNNVVQ